MNTTKLAEEYAQQTFDKNDPRYPQLVQDFKDVIKKALSQRPTPATDTPEQIRELHLAAAKLAGAPATASEPLRTALGDAWAKPDPRKPDSASVEKFQVKCRNCGKSWFIDIPAATPSGGGEWTEETVLEITENVSTVKPTRVARKAIADAHNQSLQPRDCGEDTALLDFAERYLGTIARFELVEVYHRIHGNFLAKGDNIRTAIRAAMKISSDNNKPRKKKTKSR